MSRNQQGRPAGYGEEQGASIVTCIASEHPTLNGRVQVLWGEQEVWVPKLRSIVARVGDRLLLQRVQNWPEPLVVGVVDGLAWSKAPPKTDAMVVKLERDEAVVITDDEGRPLFELTAGHQGPSVACLAGDLRLVAEGELALEGERVSVRARAGEAHIEATDDVVVRGEHIHLN